MSTTDELLEKLVVVLEKMTDAQDDMWFEDQHCNYRERERIRNEIFKPAKDEFKSTFIELVTSIKNSG